MDKDLLILIKKIKEVNDLDDLRDVKELGESFLRNQKREAILTLLSISEEMGEKEILDSIEQLSGYLESIVRQKRK